MRDNSSMRTTLTLEDDIYAAARALAEQRRIPLGRVISELSRLGLRGNALPSETRNGLRLFPKRPGASPVTPALVKELLEETD